MYNDKRYREREYIADLDDLVQRCIREVERLKWELGTTSDASYHFPEIRARKVNRLDNLKRALPRLKNYFNKKLQTLKYEQESKNYFNK